jgi:hypothetical protein
VEAGFVHPLSDALSVARALGGYEALAQRGGAVAQVRFCEKNFLHQKTMREMADLFRQVGALVAWGLGSLGFRVKDWSCGFFLECRLCFFFKG